MMNQSHRGRLLCTTLNIVSQAHFGQFDKAGEPYVLHPMRVAAALGYDDIELACIGLLHDVLEDGFIKGERVTAEYLREQLLTERIIFGVQCLTKIDGETPLAYESKVVSNYDSIRVKLKDVDDNMDLRRLPLLFSKDTDRVVKYHRLRLRLLAEKAAFEDSPSALTNYAPTEFDNAKEA